MYQFHTIQTNPQPMGDLVQDDHPIHGQIKAERALIDAAPTMLLILEQIAQMDTDGGEADLQIRIINARALAAETVRIAKGTKA